jgi:hypothetical protein
MVEDHVKAKEPVQEEEDDLNDRVNEADIIHIPPTTNEDQPADIVVVEEDDNNMFTPTPLAEEVKDIQEFQEIDAKSNE